jgi:hypothetical protein
VVVCAANMLVRELTLVAEGNTVQAITQSAANGKDKHWRGGRGRPERPGKCKRSCGCVHWCANGKGSEHWR